MQWLVVMTTIGILKQNQIYGTVRKGAQDRPPRIVSKRDRPMVLVTPVPTELQSDRSDILTAWREWHRNGKNPPDEFPEVWNLRSRANGL